jgi:hypothetical protein
VIFVVVFVGPLVVLGALAVWLDRRDGRRRQRSAPSTWGIGNEALQNHMDIDSFRAPPVQGGSMDWATYRKRDRARNAKKPQ